MSPEEKEEYLKQKRREASKKALQKRLEQNKVMRHHKISVQGTVDLWSYIIPIDRYSHTL